MYKSSSKRKAHILKNHPGQELPLSARTKGLDSAAVTPCAAPAMGPSKASAPSALPRTNETFSATVGSVTSQPHGCPHCHKQYASNAKLLQHQRKKHRETLPASKQVLHRPSVSIYDVLGNLSFRGRQCMTVRKA